MYKIIFVVLLFCINSISQAVEINLTQAEKEWMEKNPITRIAVMNYWPHDKNGESLHTEILKLINLHSGLHLVPIKFKRWKDGYLKAKNADEINGIMGLSWSKEREDYFTYSPAYDFTPAHLIVKKSNTTIHSIDDLAKKTVLLKENEISHKILELRSATSKIIDMSSVSEMAEELSHNDTIDAMFSYFIDEELLIKYDLKIVENVYDKYGEVAIGIHNNYKELSSIINKSFKKIPKNELAFLRGKEWGISKNQFKLSLKEKEYLTANKIIKVCTNPSWEPIEFLKDGKPQGISIDILNIIKEKLQVEYKYIKTRSWEESQKFLKNKKCDILPSAIKTTQREKYANFTKAYLNYDLVIITTRDKPLVGEFEYITSKTMSRQKGSGLISRLKSKYPYIKIKETDNYVKSLQEVLNEDVYFTLSLLPVFTYAQSKYNLDDLKIAGDAKMQYNLSIAVEKNNQILLNIFNKGLADIPKSTFTVVHDKWSQAHVEDGVNWDVLMKIFAVITVVIIFILVYNRKLNLTVQEKTKDINRQKEELLLLMTSIDKNVIYSKTDLNGVITHISEAFCKISGYSKGELIGKTHNIVRHDDTPKSFFTEMWKNLKKEKSFDVEIKNKSKDGSFYWVQSHLEPEYDNDNNHIGYSALIQNITDKKAIETLSKNLENIVEKRTLELEGAKKEVEQIHKHTRDSIEYASLIQHSLIPKNDIFKKYFSEYLTIWHPKDIVGGDIYLFEELRTSDECLLMVIDCTGHGVPGAFVTMLVKAIERQIVATVKHNPDEIVSPGKLLAIFNRSMKHLLRQDEEFSISNAGFDGGIIYYNKKEKLIKFSGAETPLFYTDENNDLQMIKGNRHSVGYKKCNSDFEYKEHIINVKDGMQFYLATDGYLDQNGGKKGFPFGKKRFTNIINEYKEESLSDQQEVFLEELHEYQGDEDRNDDVTLVAFKI